jgi:hypothetical protein
MVILVLVCSRFPLEMHMVHYDRRFKKLEDAAKVYQGLAVLAVLFYVSSMIQCSQSEKRMLIAMNKECKSVMHHLGHFVS